MQSGIQRGVSVARSVRRRRLIAAAVVPALWGSSAFAADFVYTGSAGTAAVPTSDNFSTGFTPSVTGATTSDLLRFNGSSVYTATDDLASSIAVNGVRVDGSPSVTIARGAGSNLIQLGGTTPFINFNNSNSSSTGQPVFRNDFEFTTSGYIVKSTSVNFAYNPVITGGTLTIDGGANVTVALADSPNDNAPELNLSSGLAGSGTLTFSNYQPGLPGNIATMINQQDFGTTLLSGNNSSFTGNTNITFGRVIINNGNAFGSGTVTIGNAIPQVIVPTGTGTATINNSGGTLNIGGNVGATYGTPPAGTTSIVIPNAFNIGGATGGNYGNAVAIQSVPVVFTGPVTFTQARINIAVNNTSTLTFTNNITETTPSQLVKTGAGNLILGGTNTYTGGTNVTNGIVSFTTTAAVPATGNITLTNAALNLSGAFPTPSAALTSGKITTTSTGVLGLNGDSADSPNFTGYATLNLGAIVASTFTGTITPNGTTYRLGGGGATLTIGAANILTGSNNVIIGGQTGVAAGVGNVIYAAAQNYTGQTNLSSQLLSVTSGLIPAASQIVANGGGVQFRDVNTVDFTPTRSITGTGTLILDTNGFDETFNSTFTPVTATTGTTTTTTYASLTKTGIGNLLIGTSATARGLFVKNGTVTINSPSVALTTNVGFSSIGQGAGDTGTLTVDNGARLLGGGQDFNVADASNAVTPDVGIVNLLNTSNNASPSAINAAATYIGKGSSTAAALAVGTVNQGPGTTFNASSNLQVGVFGTGTWNQNGGTVNVTATLSIGRNGTGVGVYNFNAGTLNNSAGNYGIVGEQGTGTINIAPGATWNLKALSIGHSNAMAANGTVNQTGGTITASNGVSMGLFATNTASAAPVFATYNFNGGVLNTPFINKPAGSNAVTVFNFNGGTVNATTNTTTTPFISRVTANVLTGGAILNNNGNNINIAANLSHGPGVTGLDGGLTLSGVGVTTVSSTASTYTGPTNISAGTLRLAAAASTNNTIPAGSIQAYYTFENPDDLLHDSSPNNNQLSRASGFSGADQGVAVFSTNAPPTSAANGSHAGSLQFSQMAYLIPASGAFPTGVPTGNQPYTIGAWINGSGVSNNAAGYGIVSWGTFSGTNNATSFRTTNVSGGSMNGITNIWFNNDLAAPVPGSGQTVVNQWHYVATTYDPTTNLRSLYVDGSLVGLDSPSGTHNASATNFTVALTNPATSQFFDGNLSDVLISNTAFTVGQLQIAQTGNLNGSSVTSTPGGQLPLTTVVQVGPTGTFDLNGNVQTIGGLTGSGSVLLGAGTLSVNPTAAGQFDGVIGGTGGLNVGGTAPFNLGGANTYTGNTTVAAGSTLNVLGSLAATGNLTSNGTTTFAASTSGFLVRTKGTLTVGAGGSIAIAANANHVNRTVLVATGLSISPTGAFDIGNSDLVVQGGSLPTISGYAAAGFNGGAPNGKGLFSSTAAADSTHTTSVAVVTAGQVGLNGFDNQTVSPADVLVKYTYFGDANVDGKVDGSDYALTDNGFLTIGSTGWYNGDFNYDTKIDGSDYSLIDNAFNRQTVNLTTASLVASPTALAAGGAGGPGSSVPEPTTLGLIGIAAAGLLGRRRRI